MEPRNHPGAVLDVQTEELSGPGDAVAVGAGRRGDLWKLALVVLALTAVFRLPAFFVDVFNSDETFLATQGQVIRAGGDLYREAADRKPPLVPYVYAAVQEITGTTDLWSVRVAAMLASVATALLLALEARRRYGRRAMWIAAILTTVALVSFAPQDGLTSSASIPTTTMASFCRWPSIAPPGLPCDRVATALFGSTPSISTTSPRSI